MGARVPTTGALWDVLFEDAGVGLCLVGPDGKVLRANAEWLRSTGLGAEQVIGADVAAIFPEARDEVLAIQARARAGDRMALPRRAARAGGRGGSWEGSIAPVPMDGGTGLLLTARVVSRGRGAPIGDGGGGEPRGSDATADVTERRRAEEALRESEEKYRALFDHMTMGFTLCRVVFDGDRPVDYVHEQANAAFEAHTGLRRAEILGRRITEVLPGLRGDPAGWIELLGNVAKTGEPIHYEHVVTDLGRWYEATAYRPKPGYFAVLFLEVTERRRALETAREANARLEQADRRKDEFISAASHELRTPLATLRLQTQTLARLLSHGRLDEHRVQKKLRGIETQLDRLDTLVNGLLDTTRSGSRREGPWR